MREGRGIFDSIRKFLLYLLSSNMGEVLTVFLGVVAAGLFGLKGVTGAHFLVLLATQVFGGSFIADSGPALAMGIDPSIDDLMTRPPRLGIDRSANLPTWPNVLYTGMVMAFTTLLTIDMYLPGGLIDVVVGDGNVVMACTAGFTVLVWVQLFNCFSTRSATHSAFTHLFTNPWLWAVVGVSLLPQVAVVHLTVLNAAFGTVPLTAGQWAKCVVMASAVLWFCELGKAVLRWHAEMRYMLPTRRLHCGPKRGPRWELKCARIRSATFIAGP